MRCNPTLGLGLDELGRFAYTRAECDDRLALIEQALDAWAPRHAPEGVGLLQTARDKLEGWRRMLPVNADVAQAG